jgi:hypothetical protein
MSLRAIDSFTSHVVIDCAHIRVCGRPISFCVISYIICRYDSFSGVTVFCMYVLCSWKPSDTDCMPVYKDFTLVICCKLINSLSDVVFINLTCSDTYSYCYVTIFGFVFVLCLIAQPILLSRCASKLLLNCSWWAGDGGGKARKNGGGREGYGMGLGGLGIVC